MPTDLRDVVSEHGAEWVPHFVRHMDKSRGMGRAGPWKGGQLTERPSEIFRRQVFATFEEEPLGPQLIPLLGPDNFMWASDYPHPDSTFPHSADAIATAFAGLDDAIVRKVTADNCRALYRF